MKENSKRIQTAILRGWRPLSLHKNGRIAVKHFNFESVRFFRKRRALWEIREIPRADAYETKQQFNFDLTKIFIRDLWMPALRRTFFCLANVQSSMKLEICKCKFFCTQQFKIALKELRFTL